MSGRDPIHLKLRELQSAGAVVRSTLQDGILRRISSLETASYLRSSEDWSQLLSQFSALGEHVDSLWKHVDTSFNFYIPVPCKPTHSHTDIPLFLSTLMSKDDENELETSLASYSSKEALDEEDIQQRNVQHNITVKDALRRFLDLEGEVRKAMSKSSTERIEKSKRAVHDLSEEEFAKRLRS